MKSKVYVGLSGGVDSAVAALLLKQRGYDVTGVFLKNWSDEFGIDNECPWEEDFKSAKAVAKHLGIPIKSFNFEKEYRKNVIEDFYYQYSIGNTPNPDILCNKYIKFGSFLDRAVSEGAEYIATGHYAKTDGERLYKPKDRNKDQTYFLHQITKSQIAKSIFPLENLDKKEVREIAKNNGLPNSKRKDSQGICFVGKVDIREFLSRELKHKTGDILDIDTGNKVGNHIGVWFYTIGQRKGLEIGGLKTPYFVCKKDVKKNILYVASGKNHPSLWGKTFQIRDLHMINDLEMKENISATIRYRSEDSTVEVNNTSENTIIKFSKPQWAPAIGQSLVLYRGDECLGGGLIAKVD